MGWLARLLGATPRKELKGIRMDISRSFWELDGETDYPALLRALADFLPEGCILYFERGLPDEELLEFFNTHAIPEQTHVGVAIVWPRPVYYHVPATRQNLDQLAALAESRAVPKLAIHFHVYREGKVLLGWHDVFAQPMLLSGDIPEDEVKQFAHDLSMAYELSAGTQQGA